VTDLPLDCKLWLAIAGSYFVVIPAVVIVAEFARRLFEAWN
jgi:uncharacterized protein YaaW (UPF0174 family)